MPPSPYEVTLVGTGATEALVPGARGRVVAVFDKAVYVRLPDGLVALTAPHTHPGPVHAVLDSPLPAIDAGTPASVEGSRLRLGDSVVVELGGAVTWAGELPPPARLRGAASLVATATAAVASRSALLAAPYRGVVAGWAEALAGGDVAAAARRLSGVGPGLTPSGDDALAGVLLVGRALGGPDAEPMLRRCAAAAATSELSRAFLAWAARGQALAPVHGLLMAAASGIASGAASAAVSLGQVGASSGADMCLGLRTALSALAAD